MLYIQYLNLFLPDNLIYPLHRLCFAGDARERPLCACEPEGDRKRGAARVYRAVHAAHHAGREGEPHPEQYHHLQECPQARHGLHGNH